MTRSPQMGTATSPRGSIPNHPPLRGEVAGNSKSCIRVGGGRPKPPNTSHQALFEHRSINRAPPVSSTPTITCTSDNVQRLSNSAQCESRDSAASAPSGLRPPPTQGGARKRRRRFEAVSQVCGRTPTGWSNPARSIAFVWRTVSCQGSVGRSSTPILMARVLVGDLQNGSLLRTPRLCAASPRRRGADRPVAAPPADRPR